MFHRLPAVPLSIFRAALQVDVPEVGIVTVDIAYGGMWYAIVNAASVGLKIDADCGKDLVRAGELIKVGTSVPTPVAALRLCGPQAKVSTALSTRIGAQVATREQFPVQHPEIDYPGVDILVFVEPSTSSEGWLYSLCSAAHVVHCTAATVSLFSCCNPPHSPLRPYTAANDPTKLPGGTPSSCQTANSGGINRQHGPVCVKVATVQSALPLPPAWPEHLMHVLASVFHPGMLDRSPCGTGTSAVMAARHARGELTLGQNFIHEGILGTQFRGRLVEETKVGPFSAVVPEIAGQAWITQYCQVSAPHAPTVSLCARQPTAQSNIELQVVVDPTDPFPEGYTVGDIWA